MLNSIVTASLYLHPLSLLGFPVSTQNYAWCICFSLAGLSKTFFPRTCLTHFIGLWLWLTWSITSILPLEEAYILGLSALRGLGAGLVVNSVESTLGLGLGVLVFGVALPYVNRGALEDMIWFRLGLWVLMLMVLVPGLKPKFEFVTVVSAVEYLVHMKMLILALLLGRCSTEGILVFCLGMIAGSSGLIPHRGRYLTWISILLWGIMYRDSGVTFFQGVGLGLELNVHRGVRGLGLAGGLLLALFVKPTVVVSTCLGITHLLATMGVLYSRESDRQLQIDEFKGLLSNRKRAIAIARVGIARIEAELDKEIGDNKMTLLKRRKRLERYIEHLFKDVEKYESLITKLEDLAMRASEETQLTQVRDALREMRLDGSTSPMDEVESRLEMAGVRHNSVDSLECLEEREMELKGVEKDDISGKRGVSQFEFV